MEASIDLKTEQLPIQENFWTWAEKVVSFLLFGYAKILQ